MVWILFSFVVWSILPESGGHDVLSWQYGLGFHLVFFSPVWNCLVGWGIFEVSFF
jgi:hypothetical protein